MLMCYLNWLMKGDNNCLEVSSGRAVLQEVLFNLLPYRLVSHLISTVSALTALHSLCVMSYGEQCQ